MGCGGSLTDVWYEDGWVFGRARLLPSRNRHDT